jgi:aromatic ring-opening dioxygenase LigB subunit
MKNPFVFACIAPHGGEIIHELRGSNPSRMETTRNCMRQLGNYMKSANPDTIIVFTPHGTRIDGQFSITECEHMVGSVVENDAVYNMERLVDRNLAADIVDEAKMEGLHIGAINFGTSEGPLSCLPLDWGTIVPLAFMPEVPIVVINPSRDISFQDHIRFGEVIRRIVQFSNRRVGLIASCDWSHSHDKNGPYGFHPASKQLDEEVVQFIKKNELEKMMQFDLTYIENAKPDGIWQSLILAGAIPQEERHVEFLSYEAPTYFGLICAAYHQLPSA